MPRNEFDALIGLRLSIVRRAADMLVVHFGDIRPHSSGEGTTGAYALHVQCPWRIDGLVETITGSADLWRYAGPGQRPADWTYEDGFSLQDRKFAELIGPYDRVTRSWLNEADRLVVTAAAHTHFGDVWLELTGDHLLRVFPAASRGEAWRFFAANADRHLVFPDPGRER
jgi:hypothetical protein